MDLLDHLQVLSHRWTNQCDRLERIKLIAPHKTTKVEKQMLQIGCETDWTCSVLEHYILCFTKSHFKFPDSK